MHLAPILILGILTSVGIDRDAIALTPRAQGKDHWAAAATITAPKLIET
jgi:hypothetical protein